MEDYTLRATKDEPGQDAWVLKAQSLKENAATQAGMAAASLEVQAVQEPPSAAMARQAWVAQEKTVENIAVPTAQQDPDTDANPHRAVRQTDPTAVVETMMKE